jgi:hypothetical protein
VAKALKVLERAGVPWQHRSSRISERSRDLFGRYAGNGVSTAAPTIWTVLSNVRLQDSVQLFAAKARHEQALGRRPELRDQGTEAHLQHRAGNRRLTWSISNAAETLTDSLHGGARTAPAAAREAYVTPPRAR